MEFFVIYLILTSTISVLAILFAILLVILFSFKRKIKWIKKIKIDAEVLNLLKVGTEIDYAPPDEKIHKNSE